METNIKTIQDFKLLDISAYLDYNYSSDKLFINRDDKEIPYVDDLLYLYEKQLRLEEMGKNDFYYDKLNESEIYYCDANLSSNSSLLWTYYILKSVSSNENNFLKYGDVFTHPIDGFSIFSYGNYISNPYLIETSIDYNTDDSNHKLLSTLAKHSLINEVIDFKNSYIKFNLSGANIDIPKHFNDYLSNYITFNKIGMSDDIPLIEQAKEKYGFLYLNENDEPYNVNTLWLPDSLEKSNEQLNFYYQLLDNYKYTFPKPFIPFNKISSSGYSDALECGEMKIADVNKKNGSNKHCCGDKISTIIERYSYLETDEYDENYGNYGDFYETKNEETTTNSLLMLSQFSKFLYQRTFDATALSYNNCSNTSCHNHTTNSHDVHIDDSNYEFNFEYISSKNIKYTGFIPNSKIIIFPTWTCNFTYKTIENETQIETGEITEKNIINESKSGIIINSPDVYSIDQDGSFQINLIEDIIKKYYNSNKALSIESLNINQIIKGAKEKSIEFYNDTTKHGLLNYDIDFSLNFSGLYISQQLD